MTWRDAFLKQARSDHAIFEKLNDPRVEYSHQLHYFQMTAEKLAKGLLTDPAATIAPATTHAAFVRMLQVLKTRPEIRRQLGFSDASTFRRYIDSLLDMAARIERLAPAHAGLTQPNPEYPWQDPATGEVLVPADFAFSEFNPKSVRMQKLDGLIRALLHITT